MVRRGPTFVLLGNGDGSVGPAVSYPDFASSVVLTDLDGDTILDLVSLGSVRLGVGDGSFGAALPYAAGSDAFAVAAADVDGDTVADLVVSNLFGGGNAATPGSRVLLGNGDGSFGPPGPSFIVGVQHDSITLTDLDGDGDADLVASGAAELSVMLGGGAGGFEPPIFHGAEPAPTAIALADLDGDGVPDLTCASTRILQLPGNTLFDARLRTFEGRGDGTFEAPLLLPVYGNFVESIAVGDLDGDAVPDIVGASTFPGSVAVLLGNGDRSFEPARIHLVASSGPAFLRVAIGDVDGDGVPDLVTVGGSVFNSDLGVLLGNGDGTFQPAGFFPAGPGSLTSLAVADLDGDGNADLVGVRATFLSVFLANGDGSFRPPLAVAAGTSLTGIEVADLDGDAVPDLVTASRSSGGSVRILRGNGDGTFQPPVAYPVGSPTAPAGGLAQADLDGDTVPDLVASLAGFSPTEGGLSILRGNPDGTFQPGVAFPIGRRAVFVEIADVDGDGLPDLLTRDGQGFMVLLGNGDATFGEALFHGVAGASLAVADFDGDGLPDVVSGSVERNAVSVAFHLDAPPLAVELDVKPGGGANVVNPRSRGVIPVAVLGSEDLDVAEIDAATLAFGPAGAAPVRAKGEDVNGDGFTDLLCHYRTQETGIAFGDTQICVDGELRDGTRIEGCDSIATVGARGRRLGPALRAATPRERPRRGSRPAPARRSGAAPGRP